MKKTILSLSLIGLVFHSLGFFSCNKEDSKVQNSDFGKSKNLKRACIGGGREEYIMIPADLEKYFNVKNLLNVDEGYKIRDEYMNAHELGKKYIDIHYYLCDFIDLNSNRLRTKEGVYERVAFLNSVKAKALTFYTSTDENVVIVDSPFYEKCISKITTYRNLRGVKYPDDNFFRVLDEVEKDLNNINGKTIKEVKELYN